MQEQERRDPTLDAPGTPPPARTQQRARAAPRRPLRLVLLALLTLGLLLVLALGSLWWWSGREHSLAHTLALAQRWLPADTTLDVQDAQGSLRFGGKIGSLRLSSKRLQLQIQDFTLRWDLGTLWQRRLPIEQLHLAALHIRTQPKPAPDDTPAQPLQQLTLPLQLAVPLRIDLLTWGDAPSAQLRQVQATYGYDGQQHQLDMAVAHPANGPDAPPGQYRAQLQLQGAAPMQLRASAQARLPAPPDLQAQLPQTPQLLHLQALASLSGTLAGAQAQLQLTAQAQVHTDADADADAEIHTGDAALPSTQALAADLQATIAPWQAQPLPQVRATLQHLNLALLAHALPASDISGHLHIDTTPQGVWALQTDLRNAQPGAWDLPALPLRRLQAQAQLEGAHWTLEQLHWQLPGDDGGQLQAQGQFDAQQRTLQVQVQLQQLNPRRILSTLPAQAISGQLQAQAHADQQVDFSVDLQPPGAPASASASLAHGLRHIRAQGRWSAPLLELNALSIDAYGAQLRSPALTWNQATQQLTSAQATELQLPGASARLQGTLAPDNGQGQLQAHITHAERLTAWLSQLPGLARAALPVQGQAQAQLDWQGGWASLLPPATTTDATKSEAARALQIKSSIDIPYLLYSPPAASAIEIKDLALQLNGTPLQLQAQLRTHAQLGRQQVQLESSVQASRPSSGAAAAPWQAQLQALTLRTRPVGHQADWQLQLVEPLTLTDKNERLHLSAGQLQVRPPAATASDASDAPATVQWEPLELDTTTLGLRTQGRFSHLPLAWADALTPHDPILERAGISGDLVLQGSWDINTLARTPTVQAMIERASGDIRIAVADEEAAPVTVVRSSGTADARTTLRQPHRGQRVRLQHLQAQLGLEAGDTLRAQLLWASERAGTIHADVRSPLQHTRQGWQWPEQAPLSGSVQLLLPNIGVWASFAPPGWRVEGSIGGDVLLGGTRSAPTWKGRIEADELGLSSLLEGVNLKNGQLRAQFAGNRLDIERLYLEGGNANQARILGRSGNLTDAPKEGGHLNGNGFIVYDPASGGNGIQMDVRAQLHNLQVLVRADRQMGLSGNLRARMEDEQLHLTGALTVDRAALLLADTSAPTLDDDVQVQSAALRQQEAQRLALKARQAARTPAPEGSVRAALQPDIHLTLDLGRDFALQGFGLTTRLTGQLTLQGGPRVTGEIHTEQGRYRAWSQSLDIEQGTIRFNGPYDNPSLDIIALRPNIAVRAGVKVGGSANAPRVQLYSDPVLPDAEKLSWVVMGRDPASGGAETALLQQAALALLSGGSGGNATGNLAGNIGLDEVGFKGANGAEGAAITLGKRLSQDLYLSYEHSLSGAMGTLFIFYDLTKRLTLRGQTGEQTAMDLIYTKRSKD
jgi:translocation and assembly module TamB